MVNVMLNTPLDPQDEIFWRQVREAVAKTEARNDLEIEIEINNRKAVIKAMPGTVYIAIYDVMPTQPELIVPAGQ